MGRFQRQGRAGLYFCLSFCVLGNSGYGLDITRRNTQQASNSKPWFHVYSILYGRRSLSSPSSPRRP